MMRARPFSSTLRPTSGEMEGKARRKRPPAAPPRALERKNAMAMVRSTSMPRTRAARGLSATARICRPSRVCASSKVSSVMRITEMPTMQSCSTDALAPPMRIILSGKVSCGNREMSGPKICSAIASNTVAIASELISPEMLESARPRSRGAAQPGDVGDGAAPGRGEAQPCETEADQPADDHRQRQRHPQGEVRVRYQQKRRERREHEHRRVREVEDVEHAEDQRVPHGKERVDAPHEDAVEDLLSHLLDDLELAVLHLLHRRLVLRVARWREGELAQRRVEVLDLAQPGLDVEAARLAARRPDGLGADHHTGLVR